MTTTSHRSAWAVLLLALTLSACGAEDPVAAVDETGVASYAAPTDPAPTDAVPTDAAAGGAAGACLEGSTGCDDTPLGGTGGVESGADGSVPVGEAVTAGVQGPFLVSGFLVLDAEGARLCEALAESFPPQCGGTSVPLQPAEVPAGASTTTEGEVTWSEQPVLLEGELVDGVFVVRTA